MLSPMELNLSSPQLLHRLTLSLIATIYAPTLRLPEGLPMGMVKDFEDSIRSAVLVCQGFHYLRDYFRLSLPNSKELKVCAFGSTLGLLVF
ncbi:hypothetical protein TorRG33x02_055280 [Trema orientale]|uniref:Uncharacterized protein n=1 Tax=Trema orientale TaxID=63057 RepID=A0A2P5FLF6_TREOI|nr:hypothetical protein TorRG33x02_055280 [Trema orientale]